LTTEITHASVNLFHVSDTKHPNSPPTVHLQHWLWTIGSVTRPDNVTRCFFFTQRYTPLKGSQNEAIHWNILQNWRGWQPTVT